MTDLELTKACAEAMGIRLVSSGRELGECFDHDIEAQMEDTYDPLHDDAQAMALVKRFMLVVDAFTGFAERGLEDTEDKCRCYSDESLNRAIVECVAKMWSAHDQN